MANLGGVMIFSMDVMVRGVFERRSDEKKESFAGAGCLKRSAVCLFLNVRVRVS